MTTSISTFSPKESRQMLARLNADGVLDERIIDALILPEGFAALECEILDYKREFGTSREALAKQIRNIAALYNTYGGYLIFGVEEQKRNLVFHPIGLGKETPDVARLKSLARSYISRNIDISYRQFEIPLQSVLVKVGVLHVPKRPKDEAPAAFGKDGPAEDNKPLFAQDSIYFRVQDNCVPAHTNEDHWFLASDRIDNSLIYPVAEGQAFSKKLIVDENLPDRNFICPEFVGRKDELLKLWQWLADDLQFGKMLAGVGGKGKSSIAYRFAEEVCRTKAYAFEKIIWLTAKKRQFRGLDDDWDAVPETHFDDYDGLLRALCLEMAITDEELDGASSHFMKQLLKSAFKEIPSLVIIDDVDSLPLDQQKMVLETRDIGNSNTRFLLTTRKNFTGSPNLCIEVTGLQEKEYADYIRSLSAALGLHPFKSKEVESLRIASEGSPLFTESLLRLVRNGLSIPEAVKLWSGKLGLAVRQAALESEVKNLSPEGRRTLLAAALLHECSHTELMQLTGYDPEILGNCLEELRALFLVSAPAIIAKEARFRVQNNTRILVIESQATLVKDPTSMQKAYERIRRGQPSVSKRGNQKSIAHAITQANAFLRNSNPEDAIETIKQAQKLHGKTDHPELLYALAKSEYAQTHPNLNNVRDILKRAYDAGQRKALFFDLWYRCEFDIKHYRGAIDVASDAIDEHSADKKGWLVKRADAKHLCAQGRGRNADIGGAIEDFIGARDDIRGAIHLAHGGYDEYAILDRLDLIQEELWRLLSESAFEIPQWLESLEVAIDAAEGGRDQLAWVERAITCVGKIMDRVAFSDKSKGSITTRQYNLVDQRISAVHTVLTKLTNKLPAATPETEKLKNLPMLLLRIKNKLDSMVVNEDGVFESDVKASTIPSSTKLEARFDVFLAHNSNDKPFIRVIFKHLKNKGVRPWLDENEIPPGRWFQDVIQDAIYRSRTAAIFIGQQGLGRWQAIELKSFINQAVKQGIPVIPVLLPGVHEIPAELSFLQGFTAVQFRNADDAEAIGSLIWGIKAP